jgi:hypothetical protein
MRFSEADARRTPILVNELDTSGFKGGSNAVPGSAAPSKRTIIRFKALDCRNRHRSGLRQLFL